MLRPRPRSRPCWPMRSASTSARIQTEDARRCIGRALDFLVGAVACPVGCGLRPVASDGGGAPEPNDFTWALDLFGDRLARRGSDEWLALVLSVAMKASISAIGCLAPDAGRTADLVHGEDGARPASRSSRTAGGLPLPASWDHPITGDVESGKQGRRPPDMVGGDALGVSEGHSPISSRGWSMRPLPFPHPTR